MPQPAETSFLYGSNSTYLAELYARYLEDRSSVDESWQRFFAELADQAPSLAADFQGPAWAPRQTSVISNGHDEPAHKGNGSAVSETVGSVSADQVRQESLYSIRALQLIRSYRVRGHLRANLDPLGLAKHDENPELEIGRAHV